MERTDGGGGVNIELEVSDNNESTSYPYWLILDPKQMMQLDVPTLASMITGPFMSRQEAETELGFGRLIRYSKHAQVYCCSGFLTRAYRDAIDKAKE
jgi:hypothetical protein